MAGYEFTGVPASESRLVQDRLNQDEYHDRLDEDKPQSPDSDEVGREAPDDTEMADCDECGDEKPQEGGQLVAVGWTHVDHMVVSTEYDWFCADCWADYQEAQYHAEIDRHERMQDDYYYEK